MKTVIIALLSLWSTFNVATAVSFLELAVPTGNFDFLNQAIQQFDIPALLANVPGSITIFGPTDDAFAAAGYANASDIPGDAIILLTKHVVMGNYTAEVLGSITCLELASLGTQSIKISVTDGEIMINNAKVTLADFIGDDATFHGIDAVITDDSFTPCPSDAPTLAPSSETDDSAAAGSAFGMASLVVASTVASWFLSL